MFRGVCVCGGWVLAGAGKEDELNLSASMLVSLLRLNMFLFEWFNKMRGKELTLI